MPRYRLVVPEIHYLEYFVTADTPDDAAVIFCRAPSKCRPGKVIDSNLHGDATVHDPETGEELTTFSVD